MLYAAALIVYCPIAGSSSSALQQRRVIFRTCKDSKFRFLYYAFLMCCSLPLTQSEWFYISTYTIRLATFVSATGTHTGSYISLWIFMSIFLPLLNHGFVMICLFWQLHLPIKIVVTSKTKNTTICLQSVFNLLWSQRTATVFLMYKSILMDAQ